MTSNIPVRKRDYLRGFFGKTPKNVSGVGVDTGTKLQATTTAASSNTSASVVAAPSLAPTPQSGRLTQEFYAAALTKLDIEDRSLIESHITPHDDNAVRAVYVAATRQKQICEDKRWPGSDRADKVLLWLDRFKFAGDIVANADPIHVGLPWAGIRVLLEAAVADSHRMTALLGGMDIALCIANRLQAYLVYFEHLRPSLATNNLRTALVALYACLLRFLAEAIRTYSMNTAARKVQAIWQNSDLITFEVRCDKLGQRIDVEAQNCDRELLIDQRAEATQWRTDLAVTLRKLDDIQSVKESIGALQVKVDLSKLSKVQEATYNSFAEERLSLCLDGTRLEILEDIMRWVEQPDGKLMFWLCGKAGTGKSTISRTIAQRLDKQRCLGASFFFKRGEQNRSNADQFFTTIAAQLADLMPSLQVPIAAALDKDSFLCGRGLHEQFEKLILQPLLSIDAACLPRHSIAIVVDALDECDQNTDIRIFLKLLSQLEAKSALQLRVFLTSRPELPIQLGFRQLDGSVHQDVFLEEVQEETIERDIRKYFESEFAKMKEDRSLLRPNEALPVDWPSNDDIQILVNLAVPLFIFASTVCRFVSESNHQKRLRVILKQRYVTGLSHLSKTYLPILDQLLLEKNEEEQKEMISNFRQIVGPIVLAADPISVSTLTSILCIDQENVTDILGHLHSVLSIPSSLHDPVQLLHQSFRDFLIDQKRTDKGGFWINETETHQRLARQCLRRLQQPGTMKKDMCGVHQPGFHRIELATQQIATQITPDIAYACSHWPWHLVQSGEQLRDNSQAHAFLKRHFLHWVEALSWIGRLSNAITYVNDLLSITKGEDCREINTFLVDAKRFILSNRLVIDLAPLQIYHSALIFAPGKTVIRQTFQADMSNLWDLLPRTPLLWSAEILKLEGHDSDVGAVAFSPDGNIIASASDDETLRLWSAQSGGEMLKFATRGDGKTITFAEDGQTVEVESRGRLETRLQLWNTQTGEQLQDSKKTDELFSPIALSPNGKFVALSSHSWMIQLSNTRTGEQMHCLDGHIALVTSLTFSPDSQTLASGSADGQVCLWDFTTGVRLHRLLGHQEKVIFIAFAPGGQTVASASDDRTVQLWAVQTGKQRHKIEHPGCLGTVLFLHDGKMMASASDDQTVRLWDVQTGKQNFVIETSQGLGGYHLPVIAMSPVEQTVLIAMHDSSLELWNAQTYECTQRLEGHDGVVEIATFSPDGHLIASGSTDQTVRVWNVQTGGWMRTLRGDDDEMVMAVAFSPDGEILASASDEQTVHLWNVQTGKLTQKLDLKRVQPGWGLTTALIFAPDGEFVLTATEFSPVQLWNPHTGEQTVEITQQIESMTAMAISPNGQTIAIGSDDGTLRLWNINGREQTQTLKLESQGKEIQAIAFSPDDQTVATGPWDRTVRLFDARTVRLFDAQTGEETLRLKLVKEEGTLLRAPFPKLLVKFSPDGQTIAGSFGRTAGLWNAQTGEQLQEFRGHTGRISALAFAPDGCTFATGSADNTVRLWDTQRSNIVHGLGGHEDRVTAVTISSDGKIAASASDDSTVRLWNPQTGSKVQTLNYHDLPIDRIVFSPNGKVMASITWHQVWLWDALTGEQLHQLEEEQGSPAKVMAFSPDGQFIALASHAGPVYIWSAQTGQRMHKLDSNKGEERTRCRAVVFSPDGQFVASMHQMHEMHEIHRILKVWRAQTGEEAQAIEVDEVVPNNVTELIFSPNNQAIALVALGFDTGDVRLWNIQTGEILQILPMPKRGCYIETDYTGQHWIRGVEVSEDGRQLHTHDGTFLLEWTPSGTLRGPLKPSTGLDLCGEWVRYQGQDVLYLPRDYRAVCAAFHGNTLMLGHASGGVSFWRVK